MTKSELARLLLGPVEAVERMPFGYASSHPLELVVARLCDGRRLELVVKDVSVLLPEAHGLRPDLAQDSGVELEIYRRVLPGSGVRAPHLFGISRGRLVLERVRARPLVEVGDITLWEATARSVARMHAGLHEPPTLGLPRLGIDAFNRWIERARALRGPDLDPLLRPSRHAAAALAESSPALVHGELYPSNVLIRRREAWFLDWETAAIGPAVLDLAALTSGAWARYERKSLALAYADEAGRSGRHVLRELERARLLLAVYWLGWPAFWVPPAGHRQDWLLEARRAAEACG